MARLSMVMDSYIGLIRSFWQLIFGIWRVSNLPQPLVSIFGGARFKIKDPYFMEAKELGRRLADRGVSVLTGGGPGIMEAIGCGVAESKKQGHIIGIRVNGIDEKPSDCVKVFLSVDYFFARKWLLTTYSVALVVFPGGFGTLDEMCGVLTQLQTKKLKRIPIILIGSEFWQPFMQWLEKEGLYHGVVSREDIALFTLTDDLDQVCLMIENECSEVV